MKAIIVYKSQTGFTERYAKWLGERLRIESADVEVITLGEAKKLPDAHFAEADVIVYGGWAMAGKVNGSEWFISRMEAWKGKKLVIFCTGGNPAGSPDMMAALDKVLTAEQLEYAKVFYCPGGIAYERMNLASRAAMKAFAAMFRKSRNATEGEREAGEMISHSYDISDEKYLDPIIEYIKA